MRTVYKIVKTWSQIEELVSYVKITKYCSFDFETTSLKYYEEFEYPTVIGISFQVGSGWVIPLGHFDSPFKGFFVKVLKYLEKHIFSDPTIIKIAWNAKYEYKWLKKYGIYIADRFFDSMLAKYPLDEERPHGLKENTARWLPDFAGYDLPGANGKNFNWAKVPLDQLSKYCAQDCDNSLRLFLFYEDSVIKKGFYPLYRNLFTPLVRVLGDMEYNGLDVDVELLEKTIAKYKSLIEDNEKQLRSIKRLKIYEKHLINSRVQAYIDKLEEEIENDEDNGKERVAQNKRVKIANIRAGKTSTNKERDLFEPINFGSPQQMANFFYKSPKGLKLPIIEYTDSGAPSTAEEVLLKLKEKDKYGFIDALLKYRELAKLDSTYISGLKAQLGTDNKIHCSFKINGTVTGRLSSTEPNMQNIPRVTTNPDIKPMFIPPKGYLWVECDYSQAELRIVAELANEEKMITWFNEGRNIHVAVAVEAEIVNTGKPLTYEEIYPITKNESHPEYNYWTKRKKRAKTINFGILYEQSPPKLAETMKCSVEEAKSFREEWLKTFPNIAKWIDRQHKKVRRDGYVTNIFGFKRRLPKIYSSNRGESMEASRQAVNSPIQGASSFYTLFSMIILEKLRAQGLLPTDFSPGYTVHDSIGFWVKPHIVHNFAKIVIPTMANPETLKFFHFTLKKVNMKASMEVGLNWGNMHEYDKNEPYHTWL